MQKILTLLLKLKHKLWGRVNFRHTMVHLPQMRIRLEKPMIQFMQLFARFIVQKFKKSYRKSRFMRVHNFQAQNGEFALNNSFFIKANNIMFMYILIHFIVQHFKKSIMHFWRRTIFKPKLAYLLRKRIFSENPLTQIAIFIHACLHSKNQS